MEIFNRFTELFDVNLNDNQLALLWSAWKRVVEPNLDLDDD
jgi:hypothetical protein